MTVTRSKTGSTPRKAERPDFVETPGRQRRSRKSAVANGTLETHTEDESTANGHSDVKVVINGSGKTPKARKSSKRESAIVVKDHRIDDSGRYEFGGPIGVTALMIFFPTLMYYMWIGATFYNGKLPLPKHGQSFQSFVQHLGRLIYTGAYPHAKAWLYYWVFLITEGIFYLYMPGIYVKGRPLAHLHNTSLTYYCSAVPSFYVTIALMGVLHVTGILPLYTVIEEFGPLMSVAIISGYGVAVFAYLSALWRGAQHRMTGNHIYDFFMGAELNPRMLELLDFKMFFEVRFPWFVLVLVTAGACAQQYETYGYVSGELLFLLMAHYLYTNACCKAEELITSTWDMYYEKWGFMLIYWNLAGVPLTYCHCTIYLANHVPSTYYLPHWALISLTVVYLFVYWVWDTTNSQKNIFRAEERGNRVPRKTFPQLPWRAVKNPKTIPTVTGDSILCDGWYGYARKIHYTCDLFFALSWGLVTGFDSPFPWFYPVFFAGMITHRAIRDIQRCRERYGEAWKEYERRVPYLFIPYVF